MSHAYTDEDGAFLAKLARDTVDQYVTQKIKPEPPVTYSDGLRVNSGVFVTLNILTGDHVSLRGCIGRPYPNQPLIQATIDSAIDSAAHDPRFPPVSPKELDSILLEISVLTPPRKIEYAKPDDLLELVKVGRDGLIAVRDMWRGLLLPQVPVEWEWNTKEFLEHTCNKAGLPKDAWKDKRTEFMSFQAEIFGEEQPRGNIVRDPKHQKM